MSQLYGCVIYDDDERPMSGWASVCGKEAYRIVNSGDLPSDVIFWTNLSSPTRSIHGLHDRLKSSTYLRPNLRQLHEELGLLSRRIPPGRITEITSEIFNRVMTMAATMYGLDRLSRNANSLHEDLYPHLVKEDRPITPDIDEALSQAYQTWQKCECVAPVGSKIMNFRRPRIQHAVDVLGTPIPGERWEFIKGEDLPPEDKRLDWLLEQARPVLAKVTVRSINHEVAAVLSFGNGATGSDRSWCSHPELLALRRFGRVRVEGAFLANEYAPHPILKEINLGGLFGPLSTSIGIMAENYVVALSNMNKVMQFPRPPIKVHSPRAVWLSASDRFHMMVPAMMLHASGFMVRGYGRGGITAVIPDGALSDARSCAEAAGLHTPLHVQEEIDIQQALSS